VRNSRTVHCTEASIEGLMKEECTENVLQIIMNFLVSTVVLPAVAQWLRCCATNRKVTGSIPDGVIEIFH